jgi:hypothetical protein
MERVYSTEELVADNNKDVLYKTRDNVSTIGWGVVDDRIDSNNLLGLKSSEQEDDTLPCYIYFILTSRPTLLWLNPCIYFNDTNNNYYNRFGYVYSWSYDDRLAGGIRCDASSYNNIVLKGNKCFFYIEIYRPSTNSSTCSMVFKIDNTIWDNKIATLQEEINPGNNVVAQLNSGESSYFKTNANYRLISPLGHVSKPKIFAKDTVNDTVTFDNIVYTMASGTKFGPLPFPWVSVGAYDRSNYDCQGLNWGVDNLYSTSTTNSYFTNNNVIKSTVENYKDGEYVLSPIMFSDSNGILGNSSYFYNCSYGSHNDIIGVNEISSGQVFSSTTTEIFDDDKAWLVDSLNGMGVIITSGEQEDTTRRIISNTYNTLTFDPPLPMPVSGSETYTVCETFYRKTPTMLKLGSDVYLREI